MSAVIKTSTWYTSWNSKFVQQMSVKPHYAPGYVLDLWRWKRKYNDVMTLKIYMTL